VFLEIEQATGGLPPFQLISKKGRLIAHRLCNEIVNIPGLLAKLLYSTFFLKDLTLPLDINV